VSHIFALQGPMALENELLHCFEKPGIPNGLRLLTLADRNFSSEISSMSGFK
jgi:hypothetical protein